MITIQTDDYRTLAKTLRKIIGSTSDLWAVEPRAGLPGYSAVVHESPDCLVEMSDEAFHHFTTELSTRVYTSTNCL